MTNEKIDIENEKKTDEQRTKKYFSFDMGKGAIQLNDKQIEAVLSDTESQLVVAGAGCGKTTMLLAKARYLILSGKAKPNEILMLSYTTKTVGDINEKIQAMMQKGATELRGLRARTFHSFGLSYVKKFKPDERIKVNLPESENGVSIKKMMETILRSNEQEALEIKKLYVKYFFPKFDDKPEQYSNLFDKDIIDYLERYINLFKSQSKYKEISEVEEVVLREYSAENKNKDKIFFDLIKELYSLYEEKLKGKGLIDFNDMITYAIEYINDSKSSLVQCEYKYIFVDEYQDITFKRYEFLKTFIDKLNQGRDLRVKIFCVGDDWQSIYGFGGSDISLFTKFDEADFFGKATPHITLNKTHRFNNVLSDISRQFIQQNNNQIKKDDLTGIEGGEERPIKVIYYDAKCEENINAMGMAVDDILKRSNNSGKILVLGRYNRNGITKGAVCQACGRILQKRTGKQAKPDFLGCNNYQTDNALVPNSATIIDKDLPSNNELVDKNDRFFRLINEAYKYENILLDKKHPDLPYGNLTFLTIHKAKGLESEYTIFLNMDKSFPHKESDDYKMNPLLYYSDMYPDAEERRMFYVALTRCKKMLYLIVPNAQKFQSPFFQELVEKHKDKIEVLNNISGSNSFKNKDIIFAPYILSNVLSQKKDEWIDKPLIDRETLWDIISDFIEESCSDEGTYLNMGLYPPLNSLFRIENNCNYQNTAYLNICALGNTTKNGKYISIYLRKKAGAKCNVDLLEFCYSTPSFKPKKWQNEIQSKCRHSESQIWKASLCYKTYNNCELNNLKRYKEEILDTLEEMVKDYKKELGILSESN